VPEERRRLPIDLGSIHDLARLGEGWQADALNRIDHLGPRPTCGGATT
jgi:hypothetical protein